MKLLKFLFVLIGTFLSAYLATAFTQLVLPSLYHEVGQVTGDSSRSLMTFFGFMTSFLLAYAESRRTAKPDQPQFLLYYILIFVSFMSIRNFYSWVFNFSSIL